MLHLSDITKSYGGRLLFKQASTVINAGERVGLVGPNGSGKTTLIRIILGEESSDSGAVRWDVPMSAVGYLPQALDLPADATLRAYLGGERHDDDALAAELERLAEQLTRAQLDNREAVEAAYHEVLERLSSADQSVQEHELKEILAGLNLDSLALDQPVAILSGGQKTRLGLAQLLLSRPAFLILDEPTNHLDISGLQWLERYLSRSRAGMLIVSHDRTFLDQVVNRILEIDPQKQTMTNYAGNYSDYTAAKETERVKYAQAYREQEVRIAGLQSTVRGLEGQARKIEGETIDFYWRKRALKVARAAVVHRKRIERMLNSEDHLEKPQQSYDIKLEFAETPESGQDVLILQDLGKRFGDLVLFKDVYLTLRRQERIVLLGPNGTGKTTLLRIIMGLEPPSQGSVRLGSNVKVGYLSQSQDTIDAALSPYDLVRANAALDESQARTFLHYFLFKGDEVFTPSGSLSYGERARLALGILVLQRCNLLLLDEPINHLDIPSRERFEHALAGFSGTVLAVVHDRYFAQRYASAVWTIEDTSIQRLPDYESYLRILR
ncbi:MAG: ABC-F family ATP-binding cassette domain-containing protein [Chloroflexi bacterium]|nr:ABC-F family ATP-binding cassette domain-containing protein [Chloroflexota bacterium]